MQSMTEASTVVDGRPAGASDQEEEDWDNNELVLGPSERSTIPKDTAAEPTEDAQLPENTTHDPTLEVSPAADVEMPKTKEGQFHDVTPDMVVEEELNYEDVIEEKAIDKPHQPETDPQEGDIEDSDAGETDGQKMPVS